MEADHHRHDLDDDSWHLLEAHLPGQWRGIAEDNRRCINGVLWSENVCRALEESRQRDLHAFEEEMQKLDRWAEDKRAGLKAELRELEDKVRESKKTARLAASLPDKLRLERERKDLEKRYDAAWKKHDEECRAIERDKDRILDETEKKPHPKNSRMGAFQPALEFAPLTYLNHFYHYGHRTF